MKCPHCYEGQVIEENGKTEGCWHCHGTGLTPEPMTAAEFEAGYAARGGLTVERLRALGRIVVPCDCDYEDSKGWHSVNAADWWADQWYELTGEWRWLR